MSPPAAKRVPAIQWRLRQPKKRLPLAKALPLLRAAVAAAPHRRDLKLQLARTLADAGRAAELVDWLGAIGDEANVDEVLLYHLGRAALTTGDHRLACRALHAAATRGFEGAFGYYAEALSLLERADEALEAGLRGIARSATDFKSFSAVARILLTRGQNERLWDLCETLCQRGATGGYVPSAMAFAARSPEQQSKVSATVDAGRWFSAEQLCLPEHFNARLSAELLDHQSLAALPAMNATDGTGRRINELDIVGGEFAQRLLAAIRNAVERYAEQRRPPAIYPESASAPSQVALNSWAIAVWSDGHETWHIHPSGWLSGVYYAAVPDVGLAADNHRGAIEFGPFPFGEDRDVPSWRRWRVAPRPELLLLFPSWYAHRTWPTGLREPRICVAFDVIAPRATGESDAVQENPP